MPKFCIIGHGLTTSFFMRKYKLVIVTKSDIKKEDREKLLIEIKKWIGEPKNDKIESLGERKFAYPIKKELKGDYTLINFEADTISAQLDKKMRIQDDVLRHLLVRVD